MELHLLNCPSVTRSSDKYSLIIGLVVLETVGGGNGNDEAHRIMGNENWLKS